MDRMVRVGLAVVAIVGLFGTVAPAALARQETAQAAGQAAGQETAQAAGQRQVAVQRDCLPGGTEDKCLWDGDPAGDGFDDEQACQSATDSYQEQSDDSGDGYEYECEDVSGNDRW
ncbi:hypothetical protein [Kitasatospora sp. NPDC001175]|uniref:hypothetical protein n=1 Tax=Kitasatospora sp. NPDC001175 TaxID=3157103 RepID=UPI003D017E86